MSEEGVSVAQISTETTQSAPETTQPTATTHELGTTEHIGPASLRTRATSLWFRAFVKPFLYLLTLWGRWIERRDPVRVVNLSLDWIDRSLRFLPPVPGIARTPVRLTNCDAEWLTPKRADHESGVVMIYCHGSGFVALGLNSHRPLISYIARKTGARVLSVGYRLAPRATVEEAVEDAFDAYRTVLAEGVPASRIVVAGDSAGGFLAAMLALRAKAEGLPVPAGQILLSGLASDDIDMKLRLMRRHPDAMFPRSTVRFINDVLVHRRGAHVGTAVFPVDADLAGLGPFLLQVGSQELLAEDSKILTERLRAAGVRAELRVYDRASHVFQVGLGFNPDSRRALEEIAEFAKSVSAVAGK